jgi:DNA-binding PadR family transcriptional regulator
MSPVFGHGALRLYLLKLLDESPRHGYELIRLLEDRFLGLYSPSAGTIYPRLARLEEDGLISHTEESGRKTYQLTDAGRAELTGRSDELARLELEVQASAGRLAEEIRDDVHATVRDLRQELKAAARDVRRQERHTGRASTRAADKAATRAARELTRELERFARDIAVLTHRHPPDETQAVAVRAVLEQARMSIERALGDPRP